MDYNLIFDVFLYHLLFLDSLRQISIFNATEGVVLF